MDRSKYPRDWPAISRAIRERAGNVCEWPGCGARNGWIVGRELPDDKVLATWPEDSPERGVWVLIGGPCKRTTTKVVLTVAHLDHDTTNNDPSNLRAWCQLHHLRYDAEHHKRNRRRTQDRKRIEAEAATQPLFPAVEGGGQ